jgi:hypothetical protein
MYQVARGLTFADEGLLGRAHVLICDRDSKWSLDVRRVLLDAGVRVVVTHPHPECQCAERFVQSIKEECLERLIPIGERLFGGRSRSSSGTIIASGIIKGSRTR